MPAEPRAFIELEDSFVLASGHEHDLVAAGGPSELERSFENGLAPAPASVLSMGDYVLDHAVGFAPSGQVRDDHDCA